MANTFTLEILTPERSFFTGEVEALIIETHDGEMGVLKDHVPMVVPVAIGPIRLKKNGEWQEAVVTEGFMKITQDKTIILCDTAEWPDEIDANRAKAAEERARERLQHQMSKLEYMRSQAALRRALSRLKVKKDMR